MGRSRSTNSVRTSMAMGAGALAVFGLGGEVARAAEQTPATAPAEATATAASDTAEAKNILDTIVVTAQRRKQSLSEVPLAVSVVSGDQFQDAGLSGVDDLQKVAPSITFSQSQSTRGSGMNIRGIGTTTFADGIEGSVGYVVDGVVVGREGGALSDLGDIERVEILRGPQGTLFGKNATAGVINLVTKRPTEDFEAEGRASYGSYNEVKVSGAASGPLTEDGSLLGRFSFFSNTRDGNVTNIDAKNGNEKMNDHNEWSGSGKLLYKPNSDFSLYLIGTYWQQDQDCCVWTQRSVSDDPLGAFATAQASLSRPLEPSEHNREAMIDYPSHQKSWNGALTLTAEYELSDYTIRSITGWRNYHTKEFYDIDSTPQPGLVAGSDSKIKQYSEELQFVSKSAKLEHTIGLFAMGQTIDTFSDFYGTFNILPASFPARTVDDFAYKTFNAAVYGQATYHFDDQWALSGGARLLYDRIESDYTHTPNSAAIGLLGPGGLFDFLLHPNPLVALGTPDAYSAEKSDVAETGMISLQYSPTRTTSAFVTLSRGYKGYGIDADSGVGTGQATIVKPEIPTDLEIGLRSVLANKVAVSLTGFWTEIDDFQAFSYDPLTARSKVRNVGKVRTRGVELEMFGNPLENLSVNGGITYTNAVIREYPSAGCYRDQTAAEGCVGGVQDLAGKRLPNAPKWSLNASTTYSQPLPETTLAAFITGDVSWRSEVLYDLGQDPNTIQGSYAIFGGRIGLKDEMNEWQIALWGKNLLNKDYAAAIFGSPYLYTGYSQFLGTERTFGVEVSAKF